MKSKAVNLRIADFVYDTRRQDHNISETYLLYVEEICGRSQRSSEAKYVILPEGESIGL